MKISQEERLEVQKGYREIWKKMVENGRKDGIIQYDNEKNVTVIHITDETRLKIEKELEEYKTKRKFKNGTTSKKTN